MPTTPEPSTPGHVAPAGARLEIERRGGIAGMKLAAEVDPGTLDAAQRTALAALLDAPPPPPSPLPITRGIPVAADRFRYRLTLTGADGAVVTREVDEDRMPAALQRLCRPAGGG